MSDTIHTTPAAEPHPTSTSFEAKAYAAHGATTPLAPLTIRRRDPGPHDVQMEILFCGVCHSDLHQVRDEWHNTVPTTYPCVPGHEIVGRVVKVGSAVTRFQPGDHAAVGCLVDSCRTCASCREGLEQYCQGPATFTYNSEDKALGGVTYGGYSTSVVVDEAFTLRVSKALDLAGAAPLLCAGITTWSPLRRWKVGGGQRVGVVGLGGLGHMGVKLANALDAHVVVFTTSPGKAGDAKRLGASEVVISTRAAEMEAQAGSFDFILNTVAAPHVLDAFTALLKRDGTLCLVGAPASPHPSPSVMGLIFGRKAIAGSLIGGIPETQEMLDFCAEHGIVADIEMIAAGDIEAAYERMLKSDVKYRFVIDTASM